MLHIVLFEPEIPPNTGNIMRLCANTGFSLHLIEPLGFTMQEKQLRRAGLDYRDSARSLAATPDGTILVSGNSNDTVKLWSLPDGDLRFFAVSSGLTGQIEFACDEVDDAGEVASGAITSGFGLGGLDEAVDAFEDAVVNVGGKPA